MQNYNGQNRFQYLADILILTGLVIVCALIFGVIGMLLVMDYDQAAAKGFAEYIQSQDWLRDARAMKLYNVISTFGAWVFSAFLLLKIRRQKVFAFWGFRRPEIRRTWLLLPFLFLSAMMIAAFLVYFNATIEIPESISRTFNSDVNEQLMKQMLAMNDPGDLFINLFVIALIPAVFEEIFFRGTLQQMMIGFTGNTHAGIAVTGLLFALIHLNVYQLIPMIFLALVLGYLYYYTGSIIPGIILHFCNNTFAILAKYYENRLAAAKMIADDTYLPGLWELLLCVTMLGGIFYYFHLQRQNLITHE